MPYSIRRGTNSNVREVCRQNREGNGKTARDVLDRRVAHPLAWTGSDASLTHIFAAVSKKLIEERITGKFFHPIAREVCRIQYYRSGHTYLEVSLS